MARSDEESLFWRVERAVAALGYEVAASHARKGGTAVILTNRKPVGQVTLEQDYGDDVAARMLEISTKGAT